MSQIVMGFLRTCFLAGLIFTLATPCPAQQPDPILQSDVLVVGKVDLAELCISRNDFLTGGLSGVSDDYYLKLHIATTVKNTDSKGLVLRGYESESVTSYEIFKTSDLSKGGKAEVEMIADLAEYKEPPHLKNQFQPVTLPPSDTLRLPGDVSIVVYLDHPSLSQGRHYLRFAINLEKEDGEGVHFFWVNIEPIPFVVPHDSVAIRRRLAQVPKTSKGFELACEYVDTKLSGEQAH